MQVQVLYFAAAREAAGTPSERLEAPAGATVGWLRAHVAARHPKLAAAPAVRVAVGERFTTDATALSPGDVVALLPPVSGG